MFERFAAKVQEFAVKVVTWQVNNRYEKAAMHLLEQTHLGASIGWLSEIVEVRGRHALVVAHH
jgi:hypothetical protein